MLEGVDSIYNKCQGASWNLSIIECCILYCRVEVHPQVKGCPLRCIIITRDRKESLARYYLTTGKNVFCLLADNVSRAFDAPDTDRGLEMDIANLETFLRGVVGTLELPPAVWIPIAQYKKSESLESQKNVSPQKKTFPIQSLHHHPFSFQQMYKIEHEKQKGQTQKRLSCTQPLGIPTNAWTPVSRNCPLRSRCLIHQGHKFIEELVNDTLLHVHMIDTYRAQGDPLHSVLREWDPHFFFEVKTDCVASRWGSIRERFTKYPSWAKVYIYTT